MRHDFPQLDCVVPASPDFAQIFAARALAPFADEVMTFLQTLSARLLRDPRCKDYPDVATFAFWCRKGSLQQMREQHTDASLRLGRGVVLHIAPANVPVNFAYSLVAGLLAGNANIVRLPSRPFPQVELICDALGALLAQGEFTALRHHVTLLRYEKADAITNFLSGHCDVRIIWGGDRTIAEIRRSPLPPRSFDLTFADRYSLCVIDADSYLSNADPARVAQDFYNDTYLFDQNACTAPHLVYWLGGEREIPVAKERFWNSLHTVVAEKYRLQPVSAIDKLADAFRFAAQVDDCHLHRGGDNLVFRIQLPHLAAGIEEHLSTSGFFYEYDASSLDELLPLLNRKVQTLAYYGVDPAKLERFISSRRPYGVDRIVPIGRTLDFSLRWDGYDLISVLSRVVNCGAGQDD